MKSNWKSLLLYASIVAVLAQIYICPSPDSVFVVSAGVICLELILIHGNSIAPFPFILLSGALCAALRTGLVLLSGGDAMQTLLSTCTFYGIFALLAQIFRFSRISAGKTMWKIGILCCFDAVSNAAELFILRQLTVTTVQLILLTTLVRGVFVWVMDVFYRRRTLYILQDEHQKRYARLNHLAASIRADAFYLSKVTEELSDLVKDSYTMYETAADPSVAQEALSLSRRSHEIHKDCARVISGLQTLTKDIEHEHMLHLRDIFRIMQDSTVRQQDITDKNLTVTFLCTGDIEIQHYYSVFTILNNLISNSVDACGTDGTIDVRAVVSEEAVTFSVTDNGRGIEADVLPYIFGAGFSTKFNPQTGESADGIGLCHVKNVTDRLGGTIDVASDEETTFTVCLPIRQLNEEER